MDYKVIVEYITRALLNDQRLHDVIRVLNVIKNKKPLQDINAFVADLPDDWQRHWNDLSVNQQRSDLSQSYSLENNEGIFNEIIKIIGKDLALEVEDILRSNRFIREAKFILGFISVLYPDAPSSGRSLGSQALGPSAMLSTRIVENEDVRGSFFVRSIVSSNSSQSASGQAYATDQGGAGGSAMEGSERLSMLSRAAAILRSAQERDEMQGMFSLQESSDSEVSSGESVVDESNGEEHQVVQSGMAAERPRGMRRQLGVLNFGDFDSGPNFRSSSSGNDSGPTDRGFF